MIALLRTSVLFLLISIIPGTLIAQKMIIEFEDPAIRSSVRFDQPDQSFTVCGLTPGTLYEFVLNGEAPGDIAPLLAFGKAEAKSVLQITPEEN